MRPPLRDYQQRAIDSVRRAIAEGCKRIVLVAPTGAGKSVMAHDIVAGSQMKGKRILFAVNRIGLVRQFAARLNRAGLFHGTLRGEETRSTYLPVLVGSIQTIARRGVDSVDVIVIDEAHAAPGSKDYRELIASMPHAIVIGLTATPWSKGMAKQFDGIDGPLFQRLVQAASISELIEQGHLVDADVWAPTTVDMTGAQKVRNAFGDLDYSDKAAAERMDKPQLVGDIVSHWHRIAPGSCTVVFASSIAHSQHIVAAFRAAGVAAEHLSAYTPLEEREAILKRHAEGTTKVVSCAALLREGWDSPECSTLILARPTRSVTAYIQMVGRVLRPHPGKSKAIVIDHSGTAIKLGLPTEDREMVLDDGKPKQSQEKERAELKPCPQCGHVDHYKDPEVVGCPVCGFVPTRKPKSPAVQEGELALLKASQTRQEKQRWWSALLHICEERGYSRGWAAHKYRARFGVWPKGLADVSIQPSPEVLRWVKSQQIRFAKAQQKVEKKIYEETLEHV